MGSVFDGADTSVRRGPLSWILRRFVALTSVESVPGTRLLSALFAAAGTSLPLGLLSYFNANEIADPEPLHRVAIVASFVAFVTAAALGRVIAPHVAGILVAALGYGFFSMSWLGTAPTWILISAWLLVSVIGSSVLLWLIGNSRWSISAASLVVGAAAAFLFGFPVSAQAPASEVGVVEREVPRALAFADVPEVRPNIYLFVLDGFARLISLPSSSLNMASNSISTMSFPN